MAEFIIGNSLRKLAREKPWLQSALWRMDYSLIWCLVGLFRLLPVDTASRLGAWVGRRIGPMMKRKHALYRDNFATVLPRLGKAELEGLTREAWARAGRVLAEYPHLDTLLQDRDRLQIEINEPIRTYTEPDQPCIIVTAHQSNWELVRSAMARLGIPNASLYSPPTNPWLDAMLLASRRALNCELLPRDNSARLLVRALKQGRSAAMVIDRRVDGGRPVSFFGRDKMATMMPARLALKFGCDMVPVQVERLQHARYRVTFHRPVTPTDGSADDNEQARDMIQQVHGLFEQWIRAEPRDWFCCQRIWPKNSPSQAGDADRQVGMDSYAA